MTVYVLDEARARLAPAFLTKTYGVFSYDHLDRQTYIQTLAQMNRLRGGPSGKENRSTLYETLVIPFLGADKSRRMVDFGSGHGDYAAALRGRGFDCHDVELFRRSRQMALDTKAIHRMIDRLCADLSTHGPYDVAILDSVLNSVDCLEAETAVMTVLNALAKVGGDVFFSGRPAEDIQRQLNYSKAERSQARRVEFLDENGFTALYRKGRWFYQKYHSKSDVEALAERFGFKILKHQHPNNSWQVHARKIRDLDPAAVAAACDYEFNLALGETQRLNRHADVKAALKLPQASVESPRPS